MILNNEIQLFTDMIFYSYGIFSQAYTPHGECLYIGHADSENMHALERIFSFTSCKEYLFQHFAKDTAPLILSARHGLKWAAVVEQKNNTPFLLHMIGPILTTPISKEEALNLIYSFSPELAQLWGDEYFLLMSSLPQITTDTLQHLLLMMQYCISKTPLSVDSITYQQNFTSTNRLAYHDNINSDNWGFMWNWEQEQQIWLAVKEGDIDYMLHLSQNSIFNRCLHFTSDFPLFHAQSIGISIISICVRAAIMGGLFSDVAYSLNDIYTQSMEGCRNAKEVSTLIKDMFTDFIQRINRMQHAQHFSTSIRNVCEYIRQHVEEELSISCLAERFGYADYYLTQKFKKETGNNLKEYITLQKINRAKFLLENSPLTIQEISDFLHFSSRNYFYSVFRRTVGIPPAEYRNKMQRGQ